MGNYLGDKPYDFAVVVFDGENTADEAFEMMKAREERTGMTVHDAAVFNRTEKGKIKLHNKGFVAGWKGGTIGLGVGLLLGGPVGGALVGSLIGFGRGSERRDLRRLVNERLGLHQSALAIVVENGNREEIEGALRKMGGEAIYAELQGETLVKLEELAADDEVTAEAAEAFDEVSSD
ncbi:MAG TPA: DUF1269 domain-containing protein [Acidimicrobiia bacterium]|jgi:uncharacterized membrane protein|nr:DUF1269 domain-containing protein [Acidimicrobiia bacterium]